MEKGRDSGSRGATALRRKGQEGGKTGRKGRCFGFAAETLLEPLSATSLEEILTKQASRSLGDSGERSTQVEITF